MLGSGLGHCKKAFSPALETAQKAFKIMDDARIVRKWDRELHSDCRKQQTRLPTALAFERRPEPQSPLNTKDKCLIRISASFNLSTIAVTRKRV